MSVLSTLLQFWELVVGGLGVLAALFFRYRANKATERARSAEQNAAAHEEMRDHERDAAQMDDDDLAARLTRRP